MFKKLRNKFLILNMIIITVVMFTSFAIIYITTYKNLEKQNYEKLNRLPPVSLNTAIRVPDDYEFPDGGRLPDDDRLPDTDKFPDDGSLPGITFGQGTISGRAPSDFIRSFNLVLNNDGSLSKIESFLEFPEQTYLEAAKQAFMKQEDYSVFTLDGQKWMYKKNEPNGRMTNRFGKETIINIGNELHFSFLDITESSRTLSSLLITFIIVGSAMLFAIFLISLYFANRTIHPMSEAWNKQRQFIADASHELKTPLTVINANVDALSANSGETIESQRKWIDYIQIQTGRMGKLINDLLFLAKTEEYESEIKAAPVNASQLVNESIMSVEAMIYEKEIILTQSIEPEMVIKSDGEKIKKAVMILLDNALKYTPECGEMTILLKREKNHMLFSDSAKLARKCGAKQLWLTHYSPALERPWEGVKVAKRIFPETIAARDGEKLTIEE